MEPEPQERGARSPDLDEYVRRQADDGEDAYSAEELEIIEARSRLLWLCDSGPAPRG